MTTIAANLQAVRERVAAACAHAGRDPGSVKLLAVGKGCAAASLREAAACGQRAFGESYLREAEGKLDALGDLGLEWHFIGPLQSNKTRPVAERFGWVHSVDRIKIAERLALQRPAILPPLNVCMQVNVSSESSKSGCPPEAAETLARAIARLPNLVLRGLMTIPEPTGNIELLRSRFTMLRQLRDRLNAQGLALDTLSMGMSHDLETAIAEGATIVRVGTAIFGERQKA